MKIKKFKKTENYCEHCHKSFSNHYILQAHIESMHLRAKEKKCDLCDKTFTWQTCVKSHMESVHFKLKKFSSKFRFINGSSKQSLKSGNSAVKEKHQCSICRQSFQYKGNLKKHRKWEHSNLKNFKCEFCQSKFYQKSNLIGHIKTMHQKLKKHQCNKTFSLNSGLKRHCASQNHKV